MSDFIIMTLTEKKLQESEEKFKILFKSGLIPAYVWQKADKDFIMVDYNYAAEDITKGSVKKFLGAKASELYKDNSRILGEISDCFKNKTTIIREMKYRMQITKEEKDLLVKYTYLPPDLVIVHTEDITERKNFEQKLKESEFKFRSLFEAIPDLYFLLSESTKVLEYRGSTEDLYIKTEEFIGKKLSDILPSPLGEKTLEFVKNTIATKQTHSFEYELLVENIIHYYEARFFYLSQKRISCFIRDITDKKKAEKVIYNLAKFPSENPNPVMRVNKKKILYINESGKNLLNATEGGKIPKQFKQILKQVFKEKITQKFEIEIDDKYFLFDFKPIKLENYVNIYGQDITKIKQFENDLLLEKKFSDDLINTSIDTIFVFNPQTGKAIRWNKAFKGISGYTDEEISSMRAPDSYYNDEDLKRAEEAIKQVAEDGSTKVEMSLITKKGNSVPFEYSGTLIEDIKGNSLIMSIGRDMKERKKIELELKESEEKFRNITEQSIVGIFILQDNTLKYVNKRACEIVGYSAEEMQSWGPGGTLKLVHPDDKEFIIEQVRKRQAGDTDFIEQYQYRIITKQGKIKWLEIFSREINYEERSAIFVILIDVTKNVEAEQQLIESEEKFRKIAEQSIMGITIIQDGLIKYFNNRISEINGYTEEDVKKWGPNDFQIIFHPEDRKFVMEQARKKQIGDPDAIPNYQYRIIRKDGEIRWIQIFSKSINYEGRPADLAMTIDITDKIKTEQQLKESEEKFRSITEQSLVGIAVLQNGLFKYANSTFSENNGYSLEEMTTWGPNDFEKTIHPEDRKFVMEQAQKKQSGDIDVINQYKYRSITKNGEIRWINLFSKTINYENRPADLVITIDITDKIKAEQQLKESEEKFRIIAEQSLVGITIIQDDQYKYYNKRVFEDRGYLPEEMRDWTPSDYLKIIHPEDREFVEEQTRIRQMMIPNYLNRYQYRIIKKNGESAWLELITRTINYKGRPANLSMSLDITDKIKVEQQIKESEEKFSKAFNSNALAMCITTFEEGIVIEANKAFLEILDFTTDDYIGKPIEELQGWRRQPERRGLMLKQLREEGIIVNVESEFVSFKGESKYGLFSFVKIELNEKPHILTIINDISPLKLAEQKVKQSEEKFSKAFNSNALAMSISTFEEGRFIEVNDAFLEYHGYTTKEEVLGKNAIELQLWDGGKRSRDRTLNLLKEEGHIVSVEGSIISKKGKEKNGLYFFVKIELNKELYILGIINEITQIKLTEKKLTESEKRYRLISEATRSVVWTADMNLNLTYLSSNTFNIFGVTAEKALLLPLISMVTPESYKIVKANFEEELNIEKEKNIDLNRSRTYEIEQIHKDGSIIPIELTFTFLRDEDGRAKGILGVSQDISERKKAEIQLKKSEKKYREAYDMMIFYKDLFTHDMNNILHIIGSSVEIIGLQLGESEKSVFIENMAKMIRSQVERGAKLISDVRTLTELDDADISINRINITKFLTHSIDFIKKSYNEKNLSIFAEDLDMKYYTTGNELLQDVFDNVLRNGIKHNENSDIQLSIKIFKQTVDGKNNIKIEFIDNGIGIPEDRKIEIFQPSNRETKGSKGMGIGLSLVKKILDIFKGKIWVEDKIEGDYTQGSKFIVLLPEAI